MNEERDRYTQQVYKSCVDKMCRDKVPWRVTVPSTDINENDKYNAIDLVVEKLRKEGKYDVKLELNVETDQNEYDDIIVISMPKQK